MAVQAGTAVSGQTSARRDHEGMPAALPERVLLDRVRHGDGDAFAALYAMHHEAVERLARRLSRDRHEADDVASEVFCNTLRAIRSGRGPQDGCRSYLLRSVRHTLINRRTRTDTARTVACTAEDLDIVSQDLDQVAVDTVDRGGPATDALCNLSDHFRDVLWYVEVEGHDSVEVADRQHIAPPAASSLMYRARRALRRSYLAGTVTTPVDADSCIPIRKALPAFVDGDVDTAAAGRVRAHLLDCTCCRRARDQMEAVHDRIAARGALALLPGALRNVVSEGFRTVGAVVGGTSTVLAATTLTIGAATLPSSTGEADAAPARPVDPAIDAIRHETTPTPVTNRPRSVPGPYLTPTATEPATPDEIPHATVPDAVAPTETDDDDDGGVVVVPEPSPSPTAAPGDGGLLPKPSPSPTTEPAQGGSGTIGDVVDSVTESVGTVVDVVIETAGNAVSTVADVAGPVIDVVEDVANSVTGGDGLGDLGVPVTDNVDQTIGDVTGGLDDLVDGVDEAVTGILGPLGSGGP